MFPPDTKGKRFGVRNPEGTDAAAFVLVTDVWVWAWIVSKVLGLPYPVVLERKES